MSNETRQRRNWRCQMCMKMYTDSELLRAVSPFNPQETLCGCPNCLQCGKGFERIDYHRWEVLMGEAAEQPCIGTSGDSMNCICMTCHLGSWWDKLTYGERVLLCTGMMKAGFKWAE